MNFRRKKYMHGFILYFSYYFFPKNIYLSLVNDKIRKCICSSSLYKVNINYHSYLTLSRYVILSLLFFLHVK